MEGISLDTMADTFLTVFDTDTQTTKRVKLVDLSDGSHAGSQSLATKLAGEDLVNDVTKVEERTNYTNLAASGLGRVRRII